MNKNYIDNMTDAEKEIDVALDKFCHAHGFGFDCKGCPLKTIKCDAKYLKKPEHVRHIEHEMQLWEVNHE